MQVGKGVTEIGPSVHLGEQAGDANGRQPPIQPVGEGFGLFGSGGLERSNLQLSGTKLTLCW
jgi:hypothetical protein